MYGLEADSTGDSPFPPQWLLMHGPNPHGNCSHCLWTALTASKGQMVMLRSVGL